MSTDMFLLVGIMLLGVAVAIVDLMLVVAIYRSDKSAPEQICLGGAGGALARHRLAGPFQGV